MSQVSGARAPIVGLLLAAMLAVLCFKNAYALDQAPPQRIIVKFREDHAQPDHGKMVAAQMQGVIQRLAVPMTHVHVNGNGADVMRIDRRLPAAELAALINEFK